MSISEGQSSSQKDHSRMAKGLPLLLPLPIAVEGVMGAADNEEIEGSRRAPMCTKRFVGVVDV